MCAPMSRSNRMHPLPCAHYLFHRVPAATCRRIAYMVWRGRRGYSWDDIPDLPALQLD